MNRTQFDYFHQVLNKKNKKNEDEDFTTYIDRAMKECKRFRLDMLATKGLTERNGAEIRKDTQSKVEMKQDLTLQKLP